ncbi:NAD(P)/FAD-dependent oxidoreductase [Streptomyces albidoflavus]|uniref:NAD(P)/FAD-dependent oxidoreductase n=1 Tax=Streptomyces albidoflavus TaxID=1886 RepID=UPI0020C0424E|nr:NAD(P)/FAD-dependent oxidoreductase [Streptomyces albidoflavus]MCL6278835.1 NAD(P)/FAD-dependent oxidoreductase [Streptomyces albidoflavus]MCX4465059.1 NAD(P)/FAD-dependent oxidoreductase [Streptomyces albidoflavus]WSI93532.1 NAD(P)/FAD-dependent oxidoreductase [Streptomyces albidoflavus]
MSTEIPDDSTWDVAVVGGSLAGCATAIHFAEKGYRVTVLDKKPLTDQHYKQLCTHFVQPHTVPLLARLGLGHLSEPAHSVTTKAVFVTPGGLVDTPGPGYDPEQPDSYALNLERRVLDPAIREAARQRGVHFLDDTAVEGVTEDDSGWTLDTRDARGTHRLRARLVVAADGRRSRLAGLLGNEAEVRPNERVALFGYFTGIDTRADNRSVFIMNEWDLACTYPLVGGRTELVLFADKARVAEWRGADSRMEEFLKYFDGLAEAPSVADAVPESPLLGYSDYPSQLRAPVAGSVPFVGDAALSLDAMAGVGCGFALLTAELLADSLDGRSLAGDDLREGLDQYRRRFEENLLPHAEGICGDSLVGKNEATRLRMFETICESQELSQKYLALTGRMVRPAEFQREFMRGLMARSKRAART